MCVLGTVKNMLFKWVCTICQSKNKYIDIDKWYYLFINKNNQKDNIFSLDEVNQINERWQHWENVIWDENKLYMNLKINNIANNWTRSPPIHQSWDHYFFLLLHSLTTDRKQKTNISEAYKSVKRTIKQMKQDL